MFLLHDHKEIREGITDLNSFGLMRENDSGGKGPMEDRKGGGKMVGMRYLIQ